MIPGKSLGTSNITDASAQRLSALYTGGGARAQTGTATSDRVLDALQAGNLHSIQNWLASVKNSEGLVDSVRNADPEGIQDWERQSGKDMSDSIDPVREE